MINNLFFTLILFLLIPVCIAAEELSLDVYDSAQIKELYKVYQQNLINKSHDLYQRKPRKKVRESNYSIISSSLLKTVLIKKNASLIHIPSQNQFRLPRKIVTKIYERPDQDGYYYLMISPQSDPKEYFKVHYEDIENLDSLLDLSHRPQKFESYSGQTVEVSPSNNQLQLANLINLQLEQNLSQSLWKDLYQQNHFNQAINIKNKTYFTEIFPLDFGLEFKYKQNWELFLPAYQNKKSSYFNGLFIGPSFRTNITHWNGSPVKIHFSVQQSLWYNIKISPQHAYQVSSKAFEMGIEFFLQNTFKNWVVGMDYHRYWSVIKTNQNEFDHHQLEEETLSFSLGFQFGSLL